MAPNQKSFTIVLTLCLLLVSCAVYKPKAYIPPNAIRNQYLKDVTSPTLVDTYNMMPAMSPEDKQAKAMRRNRILQELITLVDENYSSYETKYYGQDASVNFAGDAVNLGLTAATAVTGTAEVKSILGAVATGTTGIKTSYQKNFFDQQTRSAIVQKMRAARATQLAIIQDENHMKAPVICPPAGCPAVKGPDGKDIDVTPYSLET